MNTNEIRAKVTKLASYSRLQWNRFDVERDGYLSDKEIIIELLKACFNDAGLNNDYSILNQIYSIDELV